MNAQIKGNVPHYTLTVETDFDANPGRWQFTLKTDANDSKIKVSDIEPDVFGERLELLTIIRALESLNQPSRVTLTANSKYIRQGIQYGICEWRASDWQWEFFGNMVPVKNADLWRRIDHLMNVHTVECRQCRIDKPHTMLAGPTRGPLPQMPGQIRRVVAQTRNKPQPAHVVFNTLRRRFSLVVQRLRRRVFHWQAGSKPCPGSG